MSPRNIYHARTYGRTVSFSRRPTSLTLLRYIASLVDHLKSLEADHPADAASSATRESTASSRRPRFVHVRDSFRYLGANAPLANSTFNSLASQSPLRSNQASSRLGIPLTWSWDAGSHQYLVNMYFATIHQVYPILDPESALFSDPQRRQIELSPFEAFVLNIVYSISCHCLPGNNPQLALLSDTYHREALTYADKVTAELNLEALQAVNLLALRSLFDSQTGSLGQQIAFAHRLELELSAREVDETSHALIALRATTYCVGNQMATALDRPSGLVEPDDAQSLALPSDLMRLCGFYKTQSRFRDGIATDETQLTDAAGPERLTLSPLVQAAKNETVFLLRPNSGTAMQLLTSYYEEHMIFNVFTPHWAYKAGALLLSDPAQESPQEGYVLALTVLDRCALKWPNSRALQDVLRALARQKVKARSTSG
ncbi:hypothetical protein PV08_04332 [Exophiala spinifera]|uniref:Transcription factor domain-containing protein n=1 Tax=Exophiala spinifera TaxID=91928 RepID=A0A0D1YPL5_9EURO|nr:uncharacterized protein PV08_04332 [Exophiala spinifera]KIW17141.1 hypothetical protein PV08_04332 [Exophiala spinifera]